MEAALKEDHVPLMQLGEASEIIREVLATGRPKVITERGVEVAIILDAATYERLLLDKAADVLASDLERAVNAADAGELVEREAVMNSIRARFRGRVSVEAQRQLDRL